MKKWYAATLNDGLFIIDKKPSPNTDYPKFLGEGEANNTMVISANGLSLTQVQRIVDEHNAAVEEALSHGMLMKAET